MRLPHRRAAAATLAATTLLLAGCQAAGEELAESLSGADEIDVEDDGSFTVETTDGTTTFQADGEDGGTITFEGGDGEDSGSLSIGGDELPDDFPSSVPLPDGDIASASRFEQGEELLFSLGVQADLDADGAEAYCDEIVAAGFEQLSRTTTPDAVLCSGQDATNLVNVLVGLGGDGVTIISVSPAQG